MQRVLIDFNQLLDCILNFRGVASKLYFFVGLCWKIYSGAKKSTKQRAAIFVIERKAFDQRLSNASKADKDFLWDLYKKAISQLTRLRHPQILTVQHPLEESRDCLAFATEPVILIGSRQFVGSITGSLLHFDCKACLNNVSFIVISAAI